MDLEALLIGEGVAAPSDEIRAVLDKAEEMGRDPVEALVEEGVVVEDVMAEVLARATGTMVVDLESELDVGAADLVSKRIAIERLLVPVSAPNGGWVRVAFANPLDTEAKELIEEQMGRKVQVIVAPLGAVRRAIDKLYAGRTTRVLKSDSNELPPEITRRMLAPSSSDTSPLVRLEARATPEQRHEALLLALIERGLLTRAEYLDALERLLSGRNDD